MNSLADLSAKQMAALSQIKENVKDLLRPEHDDHFLLRFLRARNFDLKKTEAMLRRDFEWRQEVGADTVLDTFTVPEVLLQFFPGGACGQDREGSLIWMAPAGMIDFKGLLRSVRKQDLLKFNVHLMESIYRRLATLSMQQNRRVDQITLIFDFEHFGLRHLWKPGMDMFTDLVTVSEDHYPETLKTCFIINAPKIFPIAFKLVKPFLSEATARKIHIIGGNYQQTLLKYIDEDQLPKHWGGIMTDPDGNPFCASRVCMGGDVPERFLSPERQDLTGFREACVGRGSSLQVDLSVPTANCVIRWQFQTAGCDIGFGVFRRRVEGGGERRQKVGEMELVLMSQRVNSHLVPEDGSLTCTLSGTYVVRFDNTYSWTRSKKLFYLLEVLEPDTEGSKPQDFS